ncbi:LOW QUALITY PROTEIN: lymphocyte antigen 75 [Triplophysa dalaica]|uniref:LOW QUALITY PROTEIN: lymphocyte antigen 75 n=1 Tax=Triplophysa dalaica TaxID=1582913 RepID=UPI0024DF798F|nr:LOW QUALITY PROTEIN: lymphocyte antigen 75 [Triplophysa dalaica]
MDRNRHRTFISTLISLLLAESAVHLASCASAVNTGNDTFTIKHNSTGKCLLVENGLLRLGDCSPVPAASWKWGSAHRLFNVESSKCLGLEVRSKTVTLSSCTSTEIMKWRCYDDIIYTEYQMKLSALLDGTVTAKRDAQDAWKRGGTTEDICQQPYRHMHTSGGNSNGASCEFPFFYNGTWHHSCLPGIGEKTLDWCSTTANYDEEEKWGNCLKYVKGCSELWEKASGNGSCYQVVSTAVVSWHEARDACRSQGGDLLSISNPHELEFFKGRGDLPSKLWIGLNHLDWMQGWQWSDGSALSFVPWDTGIPVRSFVSDEDCGVLTEPLRFGAEKCENQLPFICEKNEEQAETSVRDVYKHTVCKDDGWVGWKGFCYQLHPGSKETKLAYSEATNMCKMVGAQLASMHSIEDIEMLHVNFNRDLRQEVWIGLIGDGTTSVFEWNDGLAMSFTYWAWAQPPPLLPNTTNCVYYSGEHHTWSVSECERPRSYMCQKLGTVNDSLPEQGCPKEGNWKRHSNACYKVETELVYFKNSCHININNRFEQAFINSLLKEYIGSETLYFWTGLQDSKGSGEYQFISLDGKAGPVTYTNWRWLEPAFSGGCVVMSAGNPLGRWAVKNCTLFKAGNLCKIPIQSVVQPTPEPVVPDLDVSCAPGWVSQEHFPYCYKVFHGERLTRKRSWEEAERFCEALGAHLPSFTEEKEMEVLHSVLRDAISDDRFFWMGLNRRNPNNDNNWEWSDGRPVSMTILPQEFQEDDEYNRNCIAFKSLKETYKTFYSSLFRYFPSRPFYPRTFHCDANLEWVCQIPRGRTPKTPQWYNPDGHHNTSVFVEGQEFWFVTDPESSFDEAVLYCSSNNSKLAAPSSFNAVRYLQKILYENTPKNVKWWANLDFHGPHVPFELSPMRYYQSNFLGRCPVIVPFTYQAFSWDCNEKLPFVCETLNVTSVEKGNTTWHSPGKKCGGGTIQFRDKCYQILSESYYQSFKKGNELCESLQGSLITISDQAEQDFITTLFPKFEAQPKKVWIGLKFKLRETQWVDNSPVSYRNFNPLLHGQLRTVFINPLEQDSLELCAYMYTDAHSDIMGTWDYTSCSDRQFSSVCQYYADKPEEPVLTKEEDFEADNHTFKVVLETNLTWIDALQLCREQNMTLASVANAYIQAQLTVRVNRRRQPLWIGLFSVDNGEHYVWADESHTKFSRWAPEATAGDCVYLDADGFWKATQCEEQLSGAICHVPQPEIITPEVGSVKCPHKSNGKNWVRFKKNCYTLLLGSSRWTNGDTNDPQLCKTQAGDGEILTIRDEEENDFIRQQLQPFKSMAMFVWLGMKRNKPDEQLKWLDGTNVQYSRWKSGERPNITQPFMVGLNLNGEWVPVTNSNLFMALKQHCIVVCKIEKEAKDEFLKDVVEFKAPEGISYRRVAKKMDWYQALKECGSDGGHLASISDQTDNDNMAVIARRDGFSLWIGLSDHDVSGWPFEWSDGTPVKYKAEGFLKGGHENEEKCVFVDSEGMWTMVSCHTTQEGAICYNHINEKANAQVSTQSSSCPKSNDQSSWVVFKDHCYAFNTHNYSVLSMEEAKNACLSLDSSSKLLTIKSQEENDFISSFLKANPSITSRVWLALNIDSKGKPTGWEDGSELDFSKWDAKSGPQLSDDTSEICGVMVSSNGFWTKASCTNSRSRIVCKAPAKSGSPMALVFFIIVLLCIAAAASFIIYQKTRHRFSSTVRYQRNFDDADGTSMITDAE